MKKSTKIISAVLASLMLVAAGCSSDKPAEKKAGGPEEKVLTVYSARSEQLNNAVIPQFEKDTGIKEIRYIYEIKILKDIWLK